MAGILEQFCDGDPNSWIQELENDRKRKARSFDIVSVRTVMRSQIFGQDVALEQILQTIDDTSQRSNRRKPLAVAMALGQPGSGKTDAFERLAAAMGIPLLIVPCNSIGSGEHNLIPWLGNSKGMAGGEDIGNIPDFLAKNPKGGIVLFDEIEKVLPNDKAPIAKAVMGLCEKGELTSRGDGQTYTAYNHIIAFTANLRQDEVTQELLTALAAGPFMDEDNNLDWERIDDHTSRVKEIILGGDDKPGFSDALLTRFTNVVVFEPLSTGAIASIVVKSVVSVLAGSELILVERGVDRALLKAITNRALNVPKPNGRDTFLVAQKMVSKNLRSFKNGLKATGRDMDKVRVRVDLSPEGDSAIITEA